MRLGTTLRCRAAGQGRAGKEQGVRYGKGPPREEFPSPAHRWRRGGPCCPGLTAQPTQLGIPGPLRSWQDPGSHPSLWHPWNPPGLLGTELELPAAGRSSRTHSGGLGQRGATRLERSPHPPGAGGDRRGCLSPPGPAVPPCQHYCSSQAARQARPWLFPALAHPPRLSCGIPGWSPLVLRARQEQGQSAPQGQSRSPAESSLRCSRFSMVLLCVCWKPAQSHD